MKDIFAFFVYLVKKRWPALLLLISMAIFIGFVSYALVIKSALPKLIEVINGGDSFFASVSVALTVLAAFITGMISYLNKGIGERDVQSTNKFLLREVMKLNKRISKVEEGSSSGNFVELTDNERSELISDAKKRMVGNTLLLAEESLKADISNINKSYNLHKLHTDMVLRLESEIDRLNRRGGVNLTIGSTIALIGIISLAYFLHSTSDLAGGLSFFIHQLPKLSFVIVVEIFAYFFLRLYKNGFDEIKYFQNEITNLEMKFMSLKYAQDFKNDNIIRDLAMHLMKTERNFILEKGQTTVSIEKDRLQNISDTKLTDLLSEIIKLKQK